MKDEYIKSILKQILDAYRILDELKGNSDDLTVIKREVGRINGYTQVLANKIEKSGNLSDSFSELLHSVKSYLKNYSFTRELDKISETYSEDPMRIKNIRLTILSSLEKSELIVKTQELLEKL